MDYAPTTIRVIGVGNANLASTEAQSTRLAESANGDDIVYSPIKYRETEGSKVRMNMAKQLFRRYMTLSS